MKPLDHFSRTSTQWDRFYLHHQYTDYMLVVHFETGEMCVTAQRHGRMTRERYRFYKDRHIIIGATSDFMLGKRMHEHGVALHHPETGEKMPMAWLNQDSDGSGSNQLLVLDLDRQMAVRLDPTSWLDGRGDHLSRAPEHIQKAGGVYYAHKGALPIGYPVTISRPYKMTPEEREHRKALTSSAEAWWEMSGWKDRTRNCTVGDRIRMIVDASVGVPPSPGGYFKWEQRGLACVDWTAVKDQSFADLSPLVRYRIVANGIVVRRVKSQHAHLDIKPVS